LKNKKNFLLVIYCFTATILFAQPQNKNNNIVQIFSEDLNHFFGVGIGLVKSPSNFTTSDLYTTGIVVFGTTSLFAVDKNVREFSTSYNTNFQDNLFKIDDYYGSFYTTLLPVSLYGFGLFTENTKIRQLGLKTAEAFIYSGIITGIFKIIIGRRRPYAGDSNMFFKPFQFTNNDYQSLPSGHTTVAFAVSTVMANYLDNFYWKVFWYGSASMVAYSRMYHNKHWVSDVALGAAIGFFVGKSVANFDNSHKNESLGIRINPFFTFNRIGFAVTF